MNKQKIWLAWARLFLVSLAMAMLTLACEVPTDGKFESDFPGYTRTSPTPSQVPAVPTGITATAQTDGSIRVSWNSVNGANGYEIYFARSPNESYDYYGYDRTTTNEYIDNEVSPGEIWYYKVLAYNDAGSSPLSEYAYATASTPSSQVPAAPTGITAVAQTNGSISVSWNSVSGATGYRIYYGSSSYGISTSSSYFQATGTSYTDTSVSPSQTRYYKVLAYNNAGSSSLSSNYAYATAPASQVPQGTQLQYNTMRSGSLSAGQTAYYYFQVSAGYTYKVRWQDSDSHPGNGYADIKVGVKYQNATSYLVSVSDSPNPLSFYANQAGYVVVEVQGYSSSSSGSFQVGYWQE
ncbi:MAG: hypothetical protein LBJ41_07250 [Treponema sp.]|nr:hypothetical protein [Treponema sp.]